MIEDKGFFLTLGVVLLNKFSKKSLLLISLPIALFVLATLFVFRGVVLGVLVPMPDINKLEPRQIVQTYYNRLALGDTHGADKCLADNYRRELSRPNVIRESVLWLSDVNISKGAHIRLYGQRSTNYDELQFTVKYSAWYLQPSGTTDGNQLSFVYVAREAKDSPWRIISIGTGP